MASQASYKPKILLTGATGYIGSTILAHLLNNANSHFDPAQITVMIRGSSRTPLFTRHGSKVIEFASLDDTQVLEHAASQHDIVIATASGYHTPSAQALVRGLGKRKASGQLAIYLHTDGTSNLGDHPISGALHETREFSDIHDDIYAYMKARNTVQAYAQRSTALTVIETGKEVNVPTYIIMSPMIYGIGGGAQFGGNTLTIQGPSQIRGALKARRAAVAGNGEGVWDYVHVQDLAVLYELLLLRILAGEEIPSGEKGIFFSGTGRFRWMDMAEGIAEAGFQLGVLDTRKVEKISLQEAANRWTRGDTLLAELGFASNSRTRSDFARGLGWKPVRTEKDFRLHFKDDFAAILQEDEFAQEYANLDH